MNDEEQNEQPAEESEKSGEQPVGSEQSQESEAVEQPSEQSDEQSSETSTDESEQFQQADQPADETSQQAPAGSSSSTSETGNGGSSDGESGSRDPASPVSGGSSGDPTLGIATSGSETKPMDEAIRNKLQLDLQSADVTPATAKKGDCSSWESDPRSFARIIADNYISTEFDHMPGLVAPEGMSCWSSQPNKNVSDFCYLHYSDGWNVIVSLSNIPDYVKARAIAPERKPMCTYSYDCTDAGTLVFTKRGCHP